MRQKDRQQEVLDSNVVSYKEGLVINILFWYNFIPLNFEIKFTF